MRLSRQVVSPWWSTTGRPLHVQNCHFRLSRVLQVQGASTAFIRDCLIDDAPVDVLRPIFPGAFIEARNLRITGQPFGTPSSIPIAIAPRERATVIGDSLVIRNCYAAILAELQSHVTLRNSHILDWTKYSVWMRDYPGPEDVTLDLVGNYWGLTDSSAIAASVWDGLDDRWNLAARPRGVLAGSGSSRPRQGGLVRRIEGAVSPPTGTRDADRRLAIGRHCWHHRLGLFTRPTRLRSIGFTMMLDAGRVVASGGDTVRFHAPDGDDACRAVLLKLGRGEKR